ncbi:hypothetical protein AGMMS50218_10700 [Actinomycetota bacterium]|nr:hypothetical protein AGMMS50218_10700 [Actinomycetota bacterium]
MTTILGDMPVVKSGPVVGPAVDAVRPGTDALTPWVTLGAEPGVAPPGVERLRALLNTDDRFHGVDHLRGRGPQPLTELRDALRAYLTAHDGAALAQVAAAHPLVLAVDGGLRLVPVADEPVAAAVGALLAELHAAQASGEWLRLKACANPDCQWVYYDASRNRSGRWCSMGECGDVMKARAYRLRTRGAAAPSGAV